MRAELFAAATAAAPDDPRLAPLQAASDRFGVLVAVGPPLATPALPRIGMVVFRPFAPPVAHAKRWLQADEVPWFSPGVEPTVVAFGAGRERRELRLQVPRSATHHRSVIRSTMTARRPVGRSTLVPAAIATALMAAQAVAGIVFPSVYRDVGFALDAWRVNDPVTAFVATPIALAALALASRGSLRAALVLLGTMQYALYNDAFYLFGAALNAHFLLYVATVVASAWALIAGFMALDAATVGRTGSGRTPPSLPARPLAGYLAFWAAVLGVAWVGQALGFAATGVEPALGGDIFRLIAALDLTLVVAPVAVAAVWLWRRRVWGANLAVVLNVKGAIYALLLAIGSALAGPVAQGGGDGLFALWAAFALGSAVSLVVLLRHVSDAP